MVRGGCRSWLVLTGLVLLAAAGFAAPSLAQSPIKSCGDTPRPSWCDAAPGARPAGWGAQGRSEVMARNGIVATSEPLAAQAGLRVLQAGGNAIDAAVTMAAMLNLTEPMNVGIAGDLFAIIYIAKENKLYQLNASGKAPAAATLKRYNDLGYAWNPKDWGFGSGMPSGIMSVTIPGAIWGWQDVLEKFGTITLKEALQPAVDYAEKGFPVTEVIAAGWTLPAALDCHPADPGHPAPYCNRQDPDAVAAWYVNGKPPAHGQIFRNPDLAKTFRLLQQQGRDAFYKGEIARAIAAKAEAIKADSGVPFITLEDLAGYKGEWVNPATTSYHGYDIYETAPPSQAWNALEILNVLDVCVPKWAPGQTLASLGPANPLYWHLLVEAKKVAYEDLYAVNSDPNFWKDGVKKQFSKLLSKDYAASLCGRVDPKKAGTPKPGSAGEADTIYLTTADRWGNMVSWVNSNFAAFGSGIGIPGYGFVLHNRGRQFTLDPKSPNVIAPGKFPYNTISAGFVMKDGKPLMTLGLMGGDMQAQGHAQVLVNILDLGANLQAATDMARFRHNQVPNELSLETPLFDRLGAALRDTYGHKVLSVNGSIVGGYQAIMFTPDGSGPPPAPGQPINGFYRAGSDHRKDGMAAGW